jgi:hypothetical protein
MNEKMIIDAYCRIRAIDQTIPDHVLDFLKDAAIEKLRKQERPIDFQYIKNQYKVPAEMYREVIVDGKRGVITKDMGNYIGVTFYDNITSEPLPCHPTWEVQYLETFNKNHR